MATLSLRLIIFIIVFILILGLQVEARVLRLISSDDDDLILSDGVDNEKNQSAAYLSLSVSVPPSPKCVHVYGFFPCAENIGGYIFLIAVYQLLLVLGEKLVTEGSNTIFNILGTGIFGASVFNILKTLPRIVMVIASGVFTSKTKAQEQVSSGLSTSVGATVLNLTLMWGICVIAGKTTMSKPSSSASQNAEPSSLKCLHILRDTGITIDKKTTYTAGIMLLSTIPFILVQLVSSFSSLFERRIMVSIALVVSIVLLLSYFVYQAMNPWIQERSLEYSKYENLLAGFLNHVQRHAGGKLINDEGQPDVHLIKRLFSETDKDASKSLTLTELENLVHSMQCGVVEVDRSYALSKILASFDENKDEEIDEAEFIQGCVKWIEEAKLLANTTTTRNLRQVVEQVTKRQKEEIAQIEHLMARILKHVQGHALEAEHLLRDDGSPNIERIQQLFREYDCDGNNYITRAELQKLIMTVKFGEVVQLDCDDSVKKVMREFDRDGNDMIDQHEFVHGITRWLDEAIRVSKCSDKRKAIDEFDKMKWGEIDKLVYEVEPNEQIHYKILTWAFNKSVLQVVFGLAILTMCATPLGISIQQLSDAMGIPSFLIPFVVVPLALNTRMAISAIFPISQKSSKTASLTFSEIYGGVVMNNLMGMTTLLAIVFAKDLSWDYSAEVLTVLVVCAIVGFLALFRTTYPLWTCLLAFFLYPFSVLLFYVLEYVLGWD
nr:sodium/calcium exchanger NCL1-like [Ipomoea batatas]